MQAILITAYKNPEYLKELINFFIQDDAFKVYVHIDKRSNLSVNDFDRDERLTIIKKYKVNWGSLNHLLAIIDLIKLAISDSKIKYIHLISGQDMPVKSISDFHFFDKDQKIYMNTTNVNDIDDPEFARRYQRGVLFANKDGRKKYIHLLNILYGYLHFPRKQIGNFKEIYKGLVWSSFPSFVGEYVINYLQKSNFVNSIEHVQIPEEFFFQTILANSKYKNLIVNNNLRYDDWQDRNGSYPAILDETDFNKIQENKYFFARKVDPEISNKLIAKLNLLKLN